MAYCAPLHDRWIRRAAPLLVLVACGGASPSNLSSENTAATGGAAGTAGKAPSEPVLETMLPERLAGALCAAMFKCTCDGALEHYGTEAECRRQLEREFAGAQNAAQQAGYTYSGDCAAEYVDLWGVANCAPYDTGNPCGSPGPRCSIYAGDARGGCVFLTSGPSYFSESCQSGYRCTYELPWCAPGPVPTRCMPVPTPTPARLGDPCPANLNCGCGSYCGDDGVCVAYGQPGDACPDRLCDRSSSYCDVRTGRCAAARLVGGACSGIECRLGLYCGPDDTCIPTGEPSVCSATWALRVVW
jgi:hypothetical protein